MQISIQIRLLVFGRDENKSYQLISYHLLMFAQAVTRGGITTKHDQGNCKNFTLVVAGCNPRSDKQQRGQYATTEPLPPKYAGHILTLIQIRLKFENLCYTQKIHRCTAIECKRKLMNNYRAPIFCSVLFGQGFHLWFSIQHFLSIFGSSLLLTGWTFRVFLSGLRVQKVDHSSKILRVKSLLQTWNSYLSISLLYNFVKEFILHVLHGMIDVFLLLIFVFIHVTHIHTYLIDVM